MKNSPIPFSWKKQRLFVWTALFVFALFSNKTAAQTDEAWNTGPYCLGQNIHLYAAPGSGWNWSGPNSFTSTEQNPTILNATALHSGLYQVTISMPDNSIHYASTTVVVAPTVNICHRQPTKTFSIDPVPGVSAYQWLIDGDPNSPAFVSGQTTTTVVVDLTLIPDGLHDISAMTDVASCNPPLTCLSFFLPPILDLSASNNGPFCAGSSVQLLSFPTGGVEPYSFSWNGPSGFSSTSQNPVLANATPSQSGSYSVTATDANGCTWSATTTISVQNAPTVAAGNGTNPYCLSENINLTTAISGGTPAFSYSWRGPNNWSSSAANPTRTNATVAMSGLYKITVTDATGCFGKDSIQVVVNPAPNATASNAGPFCLGQTISLAGGGGVSYSWSGPNGFTATTANPTRQNASVLMAGNYNLTVFDSEACSATASTTVVVSACNEVCNDGIDNDGDGLVDCYDPDCHAEVTVDGSDRVLCSGQTATLTASGGATYVWSTGQTKASIVVASTGVFRVTATNARGCTADASFSLIVNPKPVLAVSNNGPFCEMDTLKIVATGGATYNWSGPNDFMAHGSKPFLPNVTPSFSGTYTVTATNQYGCSTVGNTTVLVNPLPKDVDAVGSAITCVNSSPQLRGESSTPGLSWSWTGPGGFLSVERTPNCTLEGVYSARAFIPATGCAVLDTAIVSLDTLSFGLTASGATITCLDTAVRISAVSNFEHTTFAWSGPFGYSSNVAQPYVSVPGTYTIVATNPANGCSQHQNVSVQTARSGPTVVATGGSCNCAVPHTQLHAVSNIQNAQFFWTGPGGFSSRLTDPFVNQPGTYTVVAMNPATSCRSASATVEVVVQ